MFGDTRSIVNDMQAVGYVRVSTERQADQGVSLDAQDAKVRAMATVQGATLVDVIVDGGESAKSLNRPGLQRLLALVNGGQGPNRDRRQAGQTDPVSERSVRPLGTPRKEESRVDFGGRIAGHQ